MLYGYQLHTLDQRSSKILIQSVVLQLLQSCPMHSKCDQMSCKTNGIGLKPFSFIELERSIGKKVHSYINSIALGKKNLLSQKVRIILAKASPRRRINFFYTQCSASLPSFSCFKTLCIRCICVRKLSSNFFVHLLNKKKEVV